MPLKSRLAQIDQLQKVYYCLLKSNWRVDDSSGTGPDRHLNELVWSAEELQQGKLIKIRGLSQRQEGETVPGRCFHPQDGLGCDERPLSSFY